MEENILLKNEYLNKLKLPFEERKKLFFSNYRESMNCKSFTNKDLFSEDEVLQILKENNKLPSFGVFFLLYILSEEKLLNVLDIVEYISISNQFRLINKSTNKNKLIMKLIETNKLNIFDIIDSKDEKNKPYLDYLNEEQIIYLLRNTLAKDNQRTYYSDILTYSSESHNYESVFKFFVTEKHDEVKEIFRLFPIELKIKYANEYFKYNEANKENIDFFNDNIFIRDNENIRFKQKYENINKAYIDYYKLNSDSFNIMLDYFNYSFFTYLKNENMRKIINLKKDELNKLLDLFTVDNIMLNNDTINTILNSFLQRKFRIDNKDAFEVFDIFENLIADPRIDASSIKMLIGHIMFKEPELRGYFSLDTINDFCKRAKNRDKEAIDYFHEFSNKYIALSREKYLEENMSYYYRLLNMNKVVEKNHFKKLYILNEKQSIILRDAKSTAKHKDFVISKSFINIINFKKDPKNNPLSLEDKNNLKIFEEILNEIYENKKNIIDTEKYSKFIYEPIVSTYYDMLDIIAELDASTLSKEILNDDDLYLKLTEIINKYKLFGWNRTFDELYDKCNIDFTPSTISSFINNFKNIVNDNEIQTDIYKTPITMLLDLANCFDYKSIKYSKLFKKDNFKYIASDPGPNKSVKTKNDRINRSIELIKELYKKEYTTIPPIDKDYSINGKQMNVVVSNFTNPINLTYGERTEACIRIGGVFEDLFEFCLRDKNGFHIRFSDPNTGEFISRVSGIRNGNTIFLNELRHSKNRRYSDEDLYVCLKEVCKDLAEISKSSQDEIENIIITSDYALNPHSNELVPNNLKDTFIPLYGLKFNIYPLGDCIVLYKKGNKLNYKFNKDIKTIYRTQRDKIKHYTDSKKAKDEIYRIKMIDRLLNNEDIKDIEININYDVKEAYIGEDYYIYFDSNNNEHHYIMNNSINKDRALYEIQMLNIDLGRSL